MDVVAHNLWDIGIAVQASICMFCPVYASLP